MPTALTVSFCGRAVARWLATVTAMTDHDDTFRLTAFSHGAG
jgi:hypothetical protein